MHEAARSQRNEHNVAVLPRGYEPVPRASEWLPWLTVPLDHGMASLTLVLLYVTMSHYSLTYVMSHFSLTYPRHTGWLWFRAPARQ